MSWAFNPFTGELDKVGDSVSNTFLKKAQVVDAAFLITPEIDLGAVPITDSETVSYNGLEAGASTYSILGSTLTIDASCLKVGYNININFAS